MCTAVTYQTKDFYFGRTLDYDHSYHEEVVITPRRFVLPFRHRSPLTSHYAMIGMAYVAQEYPLYYDAVNEHGLCMAGLNFVGNAFYQEVKQGLENIAQFELIPWILAQCANVTEARALLANTNLVNTAFDEQLSVAQLHWIIADAKDCIVVEWGGEGRKVYDNPIGVLTNNPPFPQQAFHLNNYMRLSPKEPINQFSDHLALAPYGRGMGAIGLPGDLSSMSRFVRAAFVKLNSRSEADESSSVSQFFHILQSVDQQRGCCISEKGTYEITIYTSCCNATRGIYYYTTYDAHQIHAIDMHKEELEDHELKCFALVKQENFDYQN